MSLLSIDDGKSLVKLARESIEAYFSRRVMNFPKNEKFKEKRGCFVTLNLLGNLRGCIGYPEPVFELQRAIVEAARAAAFKDPRFPPITLEDLDEINIEVSVLTTPEFIEVERQEELVDKIEIGKHGLIVRGPYGSGLLLPQVFTDYDCTPKKAFEMTCEKAGLDKDAWLEEENQFYSFEAQIFEEEEPHGKIIMHK